MIAFIAKTAIGIIIQISSAIVLGAITRVIGDLLHARIRTRTENPIRPTAKGNLGLWLLVIVIGLLTAFAAANIYNFQFDKPSIAISFPRNNDSIELHAVDETMTSGTYIVKGSSRNVVSREDLRISILIHAVNPIGTGWWMWPLPTVNDDGQWEAQAGAGGKGSPVEIGQEYDIVAVAASRETIYGVDHSIAVPDIKDLKPEAVSRRVHVRIGSIK